MAISPFCINLQQVKAVFRKVIQNVIEYHAIHLYFAHHPFEPLDQIILLENLVAIEGGHTPCPLGNGVRFNGVEVARATFAIQRSFEDNDLWIVSVQRAKLLCRPRLRLQHNPAPSTPFDILAQRITRNSIIGSELDESELRTDLEHMSAHHVVEHKCPRHRGIVKLPRRVAYAFNAIASDAQYRANQTFHDPKLVVTRPLDYLHRRSLGARLAFRTRSA